MSSAEPAMKTAFITGASSGLGAAFAHLLIERGVDVYTLSRRTSEDSRVKHISCDLNDLVSTAECYKSLLPVGTGPDFVFLNAGMISDLSAMADISIDEIERVMRTNVWSNKVLLDEIFKQKTTPSWVMATSSGASRSGSKGWSSYSLSKATLNMLMKRYASEQPNTQFIALAPGLVLTPMLQGLLDQADVERFPSMKRLLSSPKQTPEEAAQNIMTHFTAIFAHDSGSFVDIRELIGQKSF